MLIVGIAGGTGSGKTTVVRKITEVFEKDEVVVLPRTHITGTTGTFHLNRDRG
jgi:uridine kinase